MSHLINTDSELYRQATDLRYELFFEEHGLPKDILFDDKELSSKHIAISDDNTLIAYGRLSALNEDDFQISQMVVSSKYQSQGFGSELLSNLIRVAIINGAKSITLNARVTALGLYEKHGFIKNGSVFKSKSTGVPHIQMQHSMCV